MLFCLWYILPIGAAAVGFVAGSGYGLASRFTGVKIRSGLLVTILGCQAAGYFAAQYVEYLQVAPCYEDGTPMSFLEYFDIIARSFAFKGDDGSLGEPMGVYGYAFRILELAGFMVGGIIAPLILKGMPYCDLCQVYMKRRNLALVPAGVLPRKIKKKDLEAQAAYDAEIAKADEVADQAMARLTELAAAGNADEFFAIVSQIDATKKETAKLTRRILLQLAFCARCFAGHLQRTSITGQGKEIKSVAMDSIELTPEFVKAYLRKVGVVKE
jgi:hypothetical protein